MSGQPRGNPSGPDRGGDPRRGQGTKQGRTYPGDPQVPPGHGQPVPDAGKPHPAPSGGGRQTRRHASVAPVLDGRISWSVVFLVAALVGGLAAADIVHMRPIVAVLLAVIVTLVPVSFLLRGALDDAPPARPAQEGTEPAAGLAGRRATVTAGYRGTHTARLRHARTEAQPVHVPARPGHACPNYADAGTGADGADAERPGRMVGGRPRDARGSGARTRTTSRRLAVATARGGTLRAGTRRSQPCVDRPVPELRLVPSGRKGKQARLEAQLPGVRPQVGLAER